MRAHSRSELDARPATGPGAPHAAPLLPAHPAARPVGRAVVAKARRRPVANQVAQVSRPVPYFSNSETIVAPFICGSDAVVFTGFRESFATQISSFSGPPSADVISTL